MREFPFLIYLHAQKKAHFVFQTIRIYFYRIKSHFDRNMRNFLQSLFDQFSDIGFREKQF